MRPTSILSATLAVLLVGSAAPALASPPSDGCARGFVVWDTATEPYLADDAADEAGNGNGWVCARQLGEGLSRQYGVDFPIYLFVDDDLETGTA
jgi:hypothetical protein